MLNTKERISIIGESIIDDISVAGFNATIDSNNPANMNISVYQNNKEAYKKNRVQARADQASFEDMAYAKQDEMIAALKTK